ncbi:diaminopropionate ammonia-lyase [Aliikangiella coralliicola]|uniref:Diaminopropionate ammonia-lyase n=1 Tax=Aliikangiella coralliicola TaxID=2592383 RepID=A0A545UGW5_9GAMM|nr:diaminopropionate ammonia-lyase [Aliikangiella coralliicola]TQV88718.1 diaminopropionate ammonia-lyase [Aliikangiella coralliicola]
MKNSTTNQIRCFTNSEPGSSNSIAEFSIAEQKINQLISEQEIKQVIQFHQSLPGYQASPLIRLNNLASQLGVQQILVKDESERFDLKAFKMLGASYAMAKQLNQIISRSSRRGDYDDQVIDFRQIDAKRDVYQSAQFVTATDGNHGRAVAWCAQLFGCKSHVYMPSGSSITRLKAIQQYAENAEITEFNYDDTVKYASQLAKANQWILMQDTAWPGYEEIPQDIMRGYFSLVVEFERQCKEWPTHVFLQAGVGSMAAAIAAYLFFHPKPTPKIILVEPEGAPCFYESMEIGDGKPHRYFGDPETGNLETIMAGLACGEPSSSAWAILSSICAAFIVCSDEVSMSGMKRYANPIADDPAIVSGESGAVTLGLVETLLKDPQHADVLSSLAIDSNARILLFSTEGDTDPDIYQQIINSAS